MHKIDRSSVDEPKCLKNVKTTDWDHFHRSACFRKTLSSLQDMQVAYRDVDLKAVTARCAYCEGLVLIEKNAKLEEKGHIEHFRRRRLFPELIFEWTNMFISCNSRDHCGHYKDRNDAPAYNPDDVIKPDEYDPEDFLQFHADGSVSAKDLRDADGERGKATIAVFGLDSSALRDKRIKTINKFRARRTEIMEFLVELNEEERTRYINSLIEYTKGHPYATAIKHFFTDFSAPSPTP